MTYNRLKVSTYLHMYTYVLLYELWWRICYSLLPDDVTTDSAPKLWREAFATELLATVYMYSYKTSSLSAKSTDIDGSENIRILNFAICTCIYILFFNERKFSAKAFFLNFLAWHWRGSMAFSLLTTPDYRNTVFIREEFFLFITGGYARI